MLRRYGIDWEDLTIARSTGSCVSLPSTSTSTGPSYVPGSEKQEQFSQLKRSFSFSAIEEGLAHHSSADGKVLTVFCPSPHVDLHLYYCSDAKHCAAADIVPDMHPKH